VSMAGTAPPSSLCEIASCYPDGGISTGPSTASTAARASERTSLSASSSNHSHVGTRAAG
jgi:hypothetical protein